MGIPIFDTVVGAFSSYREGKTKIKEAKVGLAIAKINAEAKRYEKLVDVEADWDKEALRQSQFSWKDEFLTIIFFAPFIGAFIPGVQNYVLKGFEYLDKVPEWYIVCILGIVAATFGLRWWFTKKKL